MKVAIIGRTEILYETALLLRESGHSIACILTAKEAPEYTRSADDFRELARAWSIPFAQGARIVEHRDFLGSAGAEIAVSINFTGIVPQSVIDIFPLGILNAHAGDLPRYRGNAPLAWAILNGEERIGLCIHRMIGGELDSGDIVGRDYLPIDRRTKITEAWDWMSKSIPRLMLDAVDRLSKDPEFILERQSKDPKDALRCYPRRPEDGRIDWKMPALEVLRLINASNKPFQGAFCDFEGERMTIWDADTVEEDEPFCAVPGQVLAIEGPYIVVACGRGLLSVKSVEYQGKVTGPGELIRSVRKRLA